MNQASVAATSYRQTHGLAEPSEDYASVSALPAEVTKPWVEQYLAHDPSVISAEAVESYRALITEIKAQWSHLESLGFTYSVTQFDPYTTKSGAPNSLAMRRDVEQNKHISVLATAVTGSHPFFSDLENDLFRAVHDLFGHAATERNFSADGEEAAYRHHRTMFSDKAIPALTTETRVQNSLNNVNDNSFVSQRVMVVSGAHLA